MADTNKVKALLSRLVRMAYPFGAQRKILFGPLSGDRFVVEPGHGFSYALGLGSYNFAFLARQTHSGMVVYDIGANRGQVTLFFSRAVGPSGLVYSFEPASIPFHSLQRNIALNSMSNVRAYQCVVTNRQGEEFFVFFEDRPTEGKIRRLIPQGQVLAAKTSAVPCMSLDGFVNQGEAKPDVLKIDVEGSAALVLEGARGIIAHFAPSIYIELHNTAEQKAVRDELQARGYRLQQVNGQEVIDPTIGWASPLWCSKK